MAQISDGLRLPIGAASSVVRRYPTTLTDEPERARADHARRGGRRIRGGQRRLLLPRAARRTSTAGRCRAGRGPTCCRTSAPSRPIWTSTVRCTVLTARYSFAALPNSTAAQHRSWMLRPRRVTRWVAGSQRVDTRSAGLAGNRRGAAEHQRRHTGRAWRRLPAARARTGPICTVLTNTRVGRIRIVEGGRSAWTVSDRTGPRT